MSSRTRSLLICHFDLSSSASIPNGRQSDVACDIVDFAVPLGEITFRAYVSLYRMCSESSLALHPLQGDISRSD